MALTMTRTRTQTALTSLCRMIANVHGELEFIDWAIQQGDAHNVALPLLQARRQAVLRIRDALYQTLHVFDPQLDPQAIGKLDEWLKPYGRKRSPRALSRYLAGPAREEPQPPR